MDPRLVSLDALAVTISTFFGIGIRPMVDALWEPKARPRVWIGSAVLSAVYSFFVICACGAYEESRLLMYTSFLTAFSCSSRRMSVASFKNDGVRNDIQFLSGVLSPFPFAWQGVRRAQAVRP